MGVRKGNNFELPPLTCIECEFDDYSVISVEYNYWIMCLLLFCGFTSYLPITFLIPIDTNFSLLKMNAI